MRNIALAVGNETYKRLLIIWDYRFNVLVQLIVIGLIFVGACFFLGGGSLNPQQIAPLLLGFIVWFYARIVVVAIGADLLGEAQAGTLEQMYMSPIPAEFLLVGRMCAILLTSTIMVFLTTATLVLVLRIPLPLRWEGIPILLLTLIGLSGFTLILAGAALVFKQVEALADLIQNAMLFLTGALLPIDHFPSWLAAIAQTLPITQGIVVLRHVELDQQSLAGAWLNGSLPLLLLHSAAYLSVGWLIFKYGERVARYRGTLGQY